jgi:hypothetical protein
MSQHVTISPQEAAGRELIEPTRTAPTAMMRGGFVTAGNPAEQAWGSLWLVE